MFFLQWTFTKRATWGGDEETEGKSASYLQYHNSFGVGGVKHRTGKKEPDRLTEIRLFLAVESLPETSTTKTCDALFGNAILETSSRFKRDETVSLCSRDTPWAATTSSSSFSPAVRTQGSTQRCKTQIGTQLTNEL
ncbi:hypothetical protein CEXT_109051 [Caerostris extrusa]|uniref:Uncharacterized protein n=1 Tax=Caerostris extrusa TaxID=172846 RepID=A0AAV4VJC4_CAEEX|nr:hypothetical protein CEXT_109051 [Caerostris extrusa]